jgi:SPOR domain
MLLLQHSNQNRRTAIRTILTRNSKRPVLQLWRSQATGQTGYVVQVATFRSESEAAGEFRRLQSQHPQFLRTLQQRIQRVELGASGTFYRLGLGPLSTKDQARGLCKSLIAAGEKDCLVRSQQCVLLDGAVGRNHSAPAAWPNIIFSPVLVELFYAAAA